MAKKDKNSSDEKMDKKRPEEKEEKISEEKEDKEEKEKKESSIYVKVTDETRSIIDKYKEAGKTISKIVEDALRMYNNYYSMSPEAQGILEKYEEEYGTKIREIEEAVKFFGEQKDSGMAEDRDLWLRARVEMKMMLIGKTTFNQLIRAAAEAPKEILDKTFKSNIALALINWITGKAIKTLSLVEILEAIKKMWVVANYFYIIEVKKEDEEVEEEQYLITFKHRQAKRYSIYWLGYFKELLASDELSFGFLVDGEAFDEFFTLTVKKIYDKQDVEFDLKELSLEEIVKSIKELYVKAEFFTKIDIKKEDEESYFLTMKHNKNKRYSSFWLDSFTRLFKSEGLSFKYAMEGETHDETLSLTIKALYEM